MYSKYTFTKTFIKKYLKLQYVREVHSFDLLRLIITRLVIQHLLAGDDLGYVSEFERFGKNILSGDNLLSLIANIELFKVLMVIITLIVKVLHNCLR